jgi:eukaryotic-like serine/threonine-protein kinase
VSERAAESTGSRKVGRYLVLDQFAAGGMATVHFGRFLGHEGFSRVVAIKRMREGLMGEGDARAALLDEGRLAARVQHVNVVQTLDVVAEGRELLLVMEYVVGESLDKVLKEASRQQLKLPVPVVVAIVAGALRGVHAAHEAKGQDGELLELVHRDLSPHNILVDVSGVPRVTDFGIAKARGRLTETQSGTLKGKLAYVAPEQIHGQTSRASDLFSMGVVLWECLALRRLFRGENEAETLSAVLRCQVPDLEGVPQPVMAVARRALDRLPEGRFATALAMAEALELACAPASSSEVARWMRRLVPSTLEARAERVRALEQAPFEATVVAPPPRLAHRSWWLPSAAVALLAVGLSAGFLLRREPEVVVESPPAVGPAPATVVVPEQPSAPLRPGQPPAVSDAGAPTPAPIDAGVVARPRPPPVKRPDCRVPWVLDSMGRKKYKVECL